MIGDERTVEQASMRPQPGGCGKEIVSGFLGAREKASMRPQPGGCGKEERYFDVAERRGCFNEAAARRLRKERRSDMEG